MHLYIKEFIGYDVSKVLSSKEAALKCLHWLHSQNKIKNNRPVIYSYMEIKNKLNKRFLLPLDTEILEKVKQLVNTYDMHIKDIIEHSQVNDNILKSTWSEKDFIYNGYASYAQCLNRNDELQHKLLENVDKKNNLPIFQYR